MSGLVTQRDTLETLLRLVEDVVDPDDWLVGNGGSADAPKWFLFAYFRTPMNAPPEDGRWEVDVKGDTLRAVLCQLIAHPRFEQ